MNIQFLLEEHLFDIFLVVCPLTSNLNEPFSDILLNFRMRFPASVAGFLGLDKCEILRIKLFVF